MNHDREAAALRLTDSTIASLRATFADYNYHPSPPQWTALEAIATTLAAMATGTCPAFPVCARPRCRQDPGRHSLPSGAVASADHRSVGVLICIARFDQIESIVADAGLDAADFAVFTSDDRMNALGRGIGQHRKARVLFTTHAMLECRVIRHRSFEDVSDFNFRGRPRAVRVWDEALVPGKPITVSRWSINHLFFYLKNDYPHLVGDLEELADSLKLEQDGRRIEIPDLAARHGVDIDQIRPVFRGKPEADVIAEGLWHLFGRVVTVRQDSGPELDAAGVKRRGNTILDYCDTLPSTAKN